jgi:hypothetical protein
MFKTIDHYKPDIDKTFAMLTKASIDAFHHQSGNVLIYTLPPIPYFSESLDLTKYNFEDDIEVYVDDLCASHIAMFEARATIDDAMIPSVGVALGIGEYAAFVDGEVYFQPDTSWSKPVLKSLDDFKNLPELGAAKWYGKFMQICEALLQRVAGSGIPFCRGHFSPLDLANALRGDQLYLDYYDDADGVHALLDYCATALIQLHTDLIALAEKYVGDSKYGMFYLDGIGLSEDIACMSSAKIYRQFAAPHTQRVINAFGRGYMHTHSRAMYLVKEICDLDNIVNLWLPTDPNQARPIERIHQLVEDSRGALLSIEIESFDEMLENFDDLRKGNFSVSVPANDIDHANRLCEQVEELSGV